MSEASRCARGASLHSPKATAAYQSTRVHSSFEAAIRGGDDGYGMYAVQLKSTTVPIGICGLLRRHVLSAPDLGFALLRDYVGRGFASEAARGLMLHAENELRVGRLYAIVKRGNHRSGRLLDRPGFRYEGRDVTPQGEEVEPYART